MVGFGGIVPALDKKTMHLFSCHFKAMHYTSKPTKIYGKTIFKKVPSYLNHPVTVF